MGALARGARLPGEHSTELGLEDPDCLRPWSDGRGGGRRGVSELHQREPVGHAGRDPAARRIPEVGVIAFLSLSLSCTIHCVHNQTNTGYAVYTVRGGGNR